MKNQSNAISLAHATLPGDKRKSLSRATFALLAAYAMVTIALFLASTAQAEEHEVISCSVAVYPSDTDPKGTNLRAGPSSRHKIVSVIKDSDSRLEITGSAGNWLRVRKVTEGYGAVLFAGEGWIFGPLTSVRSRGKALLYQSASKTSDSVGQTPDQEEASVQSCSGGWVKVKYKVEGWLAPGAHCGNAVTTCV